MVKLEVPYKLCFTVGKVVLKNDGTVHFFYKLLKYFTVIVKSFGGLYSCNELYHHLSVCVVVISWLLCLIMFIRNKVSEFVPP